MVANKYLVPDETSLLKNKLDKMTKNLQTSIKAGTFQTKEEYLFEMARVLRDFSRTLTEPQTQASQVMEDNLPSFIDYEELWNKLLDDLTIIFTELENVEGLVVSNFNFITTEANRLTSRLKSVSSKLGDYVLYSLTPTKDSIYFADSFNNLSRVEINSPLVNGDECEVNQEEGVATLPIDKGQDSTIIVRKIPILNPDSNGTPGNNQEAGALYNGDIRVILDSNADTWFEYERVTAGTSDNKEPLVLDLTLNLGEQKVINHVRINPNNFGTKTAIQITDIATSIDGNVYTSIKDDIPIAGFTTEDEENIFVLAPSTSKFAGQGLFTFTPRKVRYVRFILKQPEPYVIQTTSGEKLRYAIGIRDIEIKAFFYKKKGELVSTRFTSTDEIRKVILQTNQNPSEPSELASIRYQVSPDDGGTWHELQPKQLAGIAGATGLPEILNFNVSVKDAVSTAVPVKSLRLKAILERDDEAFLEGSSALHKVIAPRSELHEVPTSSPFSFTLERAPVAGSITVVDPSFGSVGFAEFPWVVGNATGDPHQSQFILPNSMFLKRPMHKVLETEYILRPIPMGDWVHVAVGGEEWTHSAQALHLYDVWDWNQGDAPKLFSFVIKNDDNPDEMYGRLTFGDNRKTYQPNVGEPITMWFEPERLFPSELQDNHLATLNFPCGTSKKEVTIRRYDKEETALELLPRGATIARLKHGNLTSTDGIAATLGSSGQKEYLNGWEELQVSGDWSVDTENGTLYMYAPTSNSSNTSITYLHQNIYLLSEEDWDWDTTTSLRDSISIKESAWKPIDVKSWSAKFSPDSTTLVLPHFSLEKGSLEILVYNGIERLDPTDEEHAVFYPFLTEVPFEELSAELETLTSYSVKYTEETLPELVEGRNEITLSEKFISSIDNGYIFSNTDCFAHSMTWDTLNNPDLWAGWTPTHGTYAIQTDPNHEDYGKLLVYCVGVSDAYAGFGDWSGFSYNFGVASPYGNLGSYGSAPSEEQPDEVTWDGGTLKYYFVERIRNSGEGKYSVDYKNGVIYTDRPLLTSMAIWISYRYTDFRIKYKIARKVDPSDYNIDVPNRTITINDGEVRKYKSQSRSVSHGLNSYYLVNYDYVSVTREDIQDLKNYFTPVLKDYALKILTKGRIF